MSLNVKNAAVNSPRLMSRLADPETFLLLRKRSFLSFSSMGRLYCADMVSAVVIMLYLSNQGGNLAFSCQIEWKSAEKYWKIQ